MDEIEIVPVADGLKKRTDGIYVRLLAAGDEPLRGEDGVIDVAMTGAVFGTAVIVELLAQELDHPIAGLM